MPSSFASPISTSSPLVDAVMERKRHIFVSKNKLKWGLANLIVAFFIFLEANSVACHIVFEEKSPWRLAFSRFESGVLVFLLTNGVLDFYNHFFPFGVATASGGKPDLTLSPKQMKLFSVSKDDPGFKCTPPLKPTDKAQHPFGFSSPLDGSFIAPNFASSTMSGSTLYVSSMDSSSWAYSPT